MQMTTGGWMGVVYSTLTNERGYCGQRLFRSAKAEAIVTDSRRWHKVTRKAVILDEITNYVQSLQRQLEPVRWSARRARLFIFLKFCYCRRAQEISRALSKQRQLLTAVPPSQRKSRDRQSDDNLQAPISGGKDGQPSDFASIFFETRKKGDHIVDLDAMEKYDDICEVVREGSSLSNIKLVEKCYGPQRHDHVFGHGGGVRPKDVRGPIASNQELHHENVTLC
ncbi:hypothetical protein ZIOFF_038381 [Zingiber officinale]|uniref:Uncharacterized protein n=1 Tax=Zingiber officinale TaxID=94328 RepID=A0A8J5G5Q1_ZINOF|nr:hypothetical protein ZIOFF_038381 [Zingiber officinale]